MTFQTDMKIGDTSWGYIPTEKYKTTKYIIDYLIDVVSKNGNLMLDIPPKPMNAAGHRFEKIKRYRRLAATYARGSMRRGRPTSMEAPVSGLQKTRRITFYYVFDTVWPGNGAQLAVTIIIRQTWTKRKSPSRSFRRRPGLVVAERNSSDAYHACRATGRVQIRLHIQNIP